LVGAVSLRPEGKHGRRGANGSGTSDEARFETQLPGDLKKIDRNLLFASP